MIGWNVLKDVSVLQFSSGYNFIRSFWVKVRSRLLIENNSYECMRMYKKSIFTFKLRSI